MTDIQETQGRSVTARAALARAAMIGVPVAVLFGIIYEYGLMRMYAFVRDSSASTGTIGGTSPYLYWDWFNERVVTVVLGICLFLGAALIPAFRKSAELLRRYFCIGGLTVLLGASAAYLAGFCSETNVPLIRGLDRDLFIHALWILAVILVMVTLYRRGLFLNDSILPSASSTYYGRVWLRIGIFFGVGSLMLAVCLLLQGWTPAEWVELLTSPMGWITVSSTVVDGISFLLAITAGYLILSVLEKKEYDNRFGRNDGFLLPRDDRNLLWITAGVTLVVHTVSNVLAMLSVRTDSLTRDPAYCLYTLVVPLFVALAAVFTLVVRVRALRILRDLPLARIGAMILMACTLLWELTDMVSNVGRMLLYGSSPLIEVYSSIQLVLSYVNLGIACLNLVALVLIAVCLHTRKLVSPAVYLIPVVQILPTLVQVLFAEAIIDHLREGELIAIYSYAMSLLAAAFSAVYYGALAGILGRVRVPKKSDESVGDAPVDDAPTPISAE